MSRVEGYDERRVRRTGPHPRLRLHPRVLEMLYATTAALSVQARPLINRIGYGRAERWLLPVERHGKELMFGCRTCGQCVVHATGMTCPMTCPKNLRNGPCGGVRANGHCEVVPEMRCTWVEAFDRSARMPVHGHEIAEIQPPHDHRLAGSSAWANMLTGEDRPSVAGWPIP
jgi:Methylene-tetrahydrofolate reductase C terminal